MSKKRRKKQDSLLPEGHPKPLTRRQFISHGLVEGAGIIVVPSVLDFALRAGTAMGSECSGDGPLAGDDPNYVACIIIDDVGGRHDRGLAAVDRNGDFLSHYDKLGLGTGNSHLTGKMVKPGNWKGPWVHQDSEIYQSLFGLDATGARDANVPSSQLLGATTLASTAAFLLMGKSNDDTGTNPFNTAYLCSQIAGNAAVQQMGTSNKLSGGNSRSVGSSPGRSIRVSENKDVENAVRGMSFGSYSTSQRESFLRAWSRMGGTAMKAFLNLDNHEQMSGLLDCAGAKIRANAASVVPNPLQDADVQQAFKVTAATNPRSVEARQATLAYHALAGKITTAVTIEIAGCDVHDGTATKNESAQRRSWSLVRNILKLAELKGRRVMIQRISDGSASTREGLAGTDPGAIEYPKENGRVATNTVIAYDPQGKIDLIDDNPYLGYFKASANDQSASTDPDNPIANEVNHGLALALAYYSLHPNGIDLWKQIPGTQGISVNSVLRLVKRS
ncbi:MAG: hypothetical protein KDD51_01255 [Bdellovibrionales bacterium]|nr:hypothetical protein [Bdellovibrionales bacterium]